MDEVELKTLDFQVMSVWIICLKQMSFLLVLTLTNGEKLYFYYSVNSIIIHMDLVTF